MSKDTKEMGGCERGELLVSVLYGEATPAEQAEFEAHRRECAACEDEFAAFGQVREQLGGWELGAVPPIRVEIRPSFFERLRRSFALMPIAARLVTASACALVLLAVVNTEVHVGSDGFTFRTGLRAPSSLVVEAPAPAPMQQAALSEEQVERVVRAQLAAYRGEMDSQLADLERQLVKATSTEDVKRLSSQVAAQRRKIDQLERDLDRTAGYGGADLFGVVVNNDESGS